MPLHCSMGHLDKVHKEKVDSQEHHNLALLPQQQSWTWLFQMFLCFQTWQSKTILSWSKVTFLLILLYSNWSIWDYFVIWWRELILSTLRIESRVLQDTRTRVINTQWVKLTILTHVSLDKCHLDFSSKSCFYDPFTFKISDIIIIWIIWWCKL